MERMRKEPSHGRSAGSGPAPPRTRHGRRKGGAAGGRTLFEISAGGVIYRRGTRGIELCLIATKGGTRWQLPKGKREDGESLEDTTPAVRDVTRRASLERRKAGDRFGGMRREDRAHDVERVSAFNTLGALSSIEAFGSCPLASDALAGNAGSSAQVPIYRDSSLRLSFLRAT